MSRFRKLSHGIWHCQYHIVWVHQYRYRVLDGPIRDAAYKGIHAICGYSGSEVIEMNVEKRPCPSHSNGSTKNCTVRFDGLIERTDDQKNF